MRKFLTLLLLLTLSLNSFGQIKSEKEICGKWKVEKITEKPAIPQAQPLIDGFRHAIFTFNENGSFELSTTSNSELFAMVTEMTNGAKWKFNQAKQYVDIGSEKDGYSVMGISVRENSGKILFHLDESGITLEMKKVK